MTAEIPTPAIPDRPSAVPAFHDGARTWTCHVVDGGHRYEWRSACGRLAVRRDGRVWRARVDGRTSTREYDRIAAAMAGAAAAVLRSTGAAA